MKQKKLYKIQNEQGLFSTGGYHPQFTTNGKSWTGTGPLKNHLHYIFDNCKNHTDVYPYRNCRICVFIMIEDVDATEDELKIMEDMEKKFFIHQLKK